MKKIVMVMLRHRALVAALLALSVVASAVFASRIRVRFQYRDFYAYPGNSYLPDFDRYSAQFGDPGGAVVVLLESDRDVFSPEILSYIQSLSNELEPNPIFSKIRSLSTVSLIRANGEDVEAGRLMDRVPDTAEELARLKSVVLGSHILSRRLVSKDSRMTAVLAEMRTPASAATVAEQTQAVSAAREALQRRPPPAGVRASVTGGPAIEVAVTRTLLRDQLVLTPAVIAVVVCALLVVFRSLQAVLLVLSTVGVSLAWTAGLFGLLGRPVDIVGSIIPTTLLVYGVVDPIFVLTRYLAKWEIHRSREVAITESLSELLLPCFLTSWTTALGFAAFITATMPTVRYLGIVVGSGILFAFLTTVTVLPLLLSVTPPPRHTLSELPFQHRIEAALEGIWPKLSPRVGLVFVSAGALLAFAIFFGRTVQINDSYVDTAPEGEERSAVRAAEAKLSGVLRFALYFEGPPGSMKRPEVLEAIAAVDRAAEREPQFSSSVSLPDLLAEANQAFNGGALSERKLPRSTRLIAQYLTLVDPDDRADFVNGDYSESHIRILAADQGGAKAKLLREHLQNILDQQQFEKLGIRAHLTGNGVVTYRELEKITAEIILGFGIAFVIVLLFEVILFRSWRLALISVVPNLIPIGACVIAMRVWGIGFRLDTSLVMCISIGGLFNTTIHILARIQQQFNAGEDDPDTILTRSLKSVGPASFYTAAILSLGFSVLFLSAFPGLRVLGGLVMVTALSGFVSDTLFTPVFARVLFGWRRKPSSAPAPVLAPS